MTGNYFGSMKLGKQLAEKAREVAQEKEDALSRLNDLEARIKLASSLGLLSAAAKAGLEEARRHYEAREYRECISTALQATDGLKKEIEGMFSSKISSTNSMMAFLRDRGTDTAQFRSAVDNVQQLLSSEKYEEAESALTSIWQKEEKTLAELFSHEFSAVQKALIEAKKYSSEIEGVDRVLSDAREEVTANNIENAFHLLGQAGGLISRQMKLRIDEETKQLSQKVELSRQLGLGIGNYKDKLEQIRSSPAEQKFGEFQQILDSLNSELDRKLRRAFEIRLKTIRSDLSERTLPPSLIASASSTLKGIDVQINGGDFETAYRGLTELESGLEKAKYDYIARILFNGKKYITMALKSGIDLAPVNRHLNEVRELMKKRRYREAIAEAELANKDAMKLATIKTDADELAAKLDTEFQVLVSLVSNSVDLSIRYTDAKRKLDAKDLDDFLTEAKPLLNDIDTLLENFSTGQVDALDRCISAIEYLGAETLEVNKKLGNAVSLIKNSEFAKSLQVTSELEREVDSKLKELNSSWTVRAAAAAGASTGMMHERLEKMMETVRAFESKGEDYRSASVAKDIVDWAANGNVYRVRSLIQRARRLLSVVPDVTSTSSLNMLEAAERNAEIDTESALNTAGDAHDILYGLLNDYFVKEMASLMDMVSTCRRKRVEIGYGYTLIGRARAALKFEDFEAAARMVSVAREEIHRRLRQVEDIESDMSKADRLLSEAKKGKGDTSEVQKLLMDARASLKRYDYVQARKEISQALLLEEKSMASNLAAREIINVKSVLAVAKEIGASNDEMEQRKEELLGLMRDRNHYDALVAARNLSKELSNTVNTILTSMIGDIAADSAKAEMDGLDTNVVESRLERARGFIVSGQFDQCLASLKLARDELGLARNSVNEAIAMIEKADSLTIKIDDLNLLDTGTLSLLKQSKNLLKNDQHLLALQTAQKCIESCNDRLKAKGPQLLEAYSRQIYSCMGSDESDGLMEQVNSFTNAVATGVQESADALIALKNVSERLALQQEMAKRTFEVLSRRATALSESGVSSPEVNAQIDGIGVLLEMKNYRSVIEKGIEAEQLMEDLTRGSERAKQRMSQLQDKLVRYEELGLDMEECKSRARDALELISAGKVSEGAARMQECETAADSALHGACVSRVAAVESASEIAVKLGIPSAGGYDYDEMLVGGDIAGAYTVASRKLEEIAPLVISSLRAKFESVMQSDGLSHNFISGLKKEFEELVATGRLSDAFDFVMRSEVDVSSKSAIVAEMNNLSRQFSEVVSELRKTGINVRSFDMRFNNLTKDISEQSLSELKKLVGEMLKLKAEYSPRISIAPQSSKWGPQLVLTNNGRAVALNPSIIIRGPLLSKTEALGNLKPGESRTINLPPTIHGDVTVTISAGNPVDRSEFTLVKQFQLDGNSISANMQCALCRGRIKDGSRSYECTCGRAYHEQCARRRETCECGIRITIA